MEQKTITQVNAADRLRELHGQVASLFQEQASGSALVRHLCHGVDGILVGLWRSCAGSASQEVDLLAVGGYGRGELCPHSDWDLWFLLPDQPNTGIKEDITRFMYLLWDLGVEVGHAVRTIDETLAHIRVDWDSATAVIEARLLCGRGNTYAIFKEKLNKQAKKRDRKMFIRAKLEEFDQRRLKMDTAFLMEPDIKVGKGGLRDIQVVFWMGLAWYNAPSIHSLLSLNIISDSEYQQLLRARDFLWRCRVGLHLENSNGNNRMTFEAQSSLARSMQFKDRRYRPAVEGFMKRYFLHAGHVADLSEMFVMHFQEQLKPRRFVRRKNIGDGFYLQGKKWVGVQDEAVFSSDPLRLLKIFHVAQQEHRRLESNALRTIRKNTHLIDAEFNKRTEVSRLFLSILRGQRNIAWTLKEMKNTGVLGRLIPAFGKIVAQGQYDRYHAYTVDEHSIRAVATSRKFYLGRSDSNRFPLACELMSQIKRPELLYLALLFHDLAKGKGIDHSQGGEILARKFCRRLGLNSDASELVSWLVRNHLFMACTAQSSDLGEDSVIEAFASKIGDIEQLQYLYLLTVADICAVGPNIWNDWKGSLLRELYHLTEQVLLTGPVAGKQMQRRIQSRIESALNTAEDSEREQLARLLRALPSRAQIYFPPLQLLAIGRLMMRGKEQPEADIYEDLGRGETEVLVLTKGHAGLFAQLTTAIARGHVNIVAAKAFDLGSDRVLDVFHVQNSRGKPLSELRDQQRLLKRINEVLSGNHPEYNYKIPNKHHVLMKRVAVSARLLPSASKRQTAIEIVAADRPGLLAQLATAIVEMGINVRGASISTFGEKVEDVFFLTDQEGKPLSDEVAVRLCDSLKTVAFLPEET